MLKMSVSVAEEERSLAAEEVHLQDSESSSPLLPSSPVCVHQRVPALPTEVCERIIDFVAQEDAFVSRWMLWKQDVCDTLLACALTCRAWAPRAQLHLFRFLGVHCAPRDRRSPEAFAALVGRHGALRTYVESLSVYLGDDATASTWRALAVRAPHMLPRLRHFRLARGTLYPAPGHAFEMSLRQFVSVRRLSLWAVTFYSVADLRRAVSAIHGLQNLVISWLAWHTPPPPALPTRFPPCRARIADLRIDAQAAWLADPRSAYVVNWLARSGAASSLHTIGFSQMMILDQTMLASVAAVIDASRNTLRMVYLSLSSSVDVAMRTCIITSMRPALTLSCPVCPALSRCWRTVQISLILPYASSVLAQLCALLNNLHAKLSLLSLCFLQHPDKMCAEPAAADWAPLDAALQHEKWESLDVAVVRAPIRVDPGFAWGDFYEMMPFDEDGLCCDLRAWLPLTHKRKALWYLTDTNSSMIPVPQQD